MELWLESRFTNNFNFSFLITQINKCTYKIIVLLLQMVLIVGLSRGLSSSHPTRVRK